MPNTNPVSWREARDILRHGDILLCRAASPEGRAITHVTQAEYSHAAVVGILYESLDPLAKPVFYQAETVQHNEARIIDLKGEVKRYPGLYDVYRVRKDDLHYYHPNWLWQFMSDASGGCYGLVYILCVYFRRRLGRWFPAPKNSDKPQASRDCSGLVHAALRWAQGPQIKDRDVDVTPQDLADSAFTDYICTLYIDVPETK